MIRSEYEVRRSAHKTRRNGKQTANAQNRANNNSDTSDLEANYCSKNRVKSKRRSNFISKLIRRCLLSDKYKYIPLDDSDSIENEPLDDINNNINTTFEIDSNNHFNSNSKKACCCFCCCFYCCCHFFKRLFTMFFK